MMATKICRPIKAMGMVAGNTAITTPKTADLDQAAMVAIENKPRKIVYSRSLATMFAQRRTVKERMSAEVLTSSTGKTKMANSVMAHSLPIEVQKCQDGACQGNRLVGGRRGKDWDDAEQVGQKNENGD